MVRAYVGLFCNFDETCKTKSLSGVKLCIISVTGRENELISSRTPSRLVIIKLSSFSVSKTTWFKKKNNEFRKYIPFKLMLTVNHLSSGKLIYLVTLDVAHNHLEHLPKGLTFKLLSCC